MNTYKTDISNYLLQGQMGLLQGEYTEEMTAAWLSTAIELAESFYLSEGLTVNCVTGEVTGDADPEDLELLEEKAKGLIDGIALD